MNSERIRISLVEDTYAYAGRTHIEENVETFKTKIQEYINILKELVESDLDKLNDKKLYELLSNIYDITLDEEDYLKMFSKYNNKKYTFIHRIPTTMTLTRRTAQGHGRSFDWWNQLYQVYYLVATSDTFEFDYNKTYSKEEIKKIISDKSIVILKQEEVAINGNQNFVKESYEPIPTLDIDIKNYSDNMSQFILNNYSLFGELLRKKFTKHTVLKDVKKIIDDLNQDMQVIFSTAQLKEQLYSDIAIICKEWFESSAERKDYQVIQKKLELRKKIIFK